MNTRGKRRTIPKGIISWLVGNMHVGTTDEEIRANIRSRCTGDGWTPKRIRAAEDYAVRCMEQHRKLVKQFRFYIY